MTAIKDFDQCRYLSESPLLIAIGWLGKDSEFERGNVDATFFKKLSELCRSPWEHVAAAGFHQCELCQFPDHGFTANVYIPYGGRIFAAPVGIVHYIDAHWYRPPDMFIQAVMACPKMHSMSYLRLLLANGGKDLGMQELPCN